MNLFLDQGKKVVGIPFLGEGKVHGEDFFDFLFELLNEDENKSAFLLEILTELDEEQLKANLKKWVKQGIYAAWRFTTHKPIKNVGIVFVQQDTPHSIKYHFLIKDEFLEGLDKPVRKSVKCKKCGHVFKVKYEEKKIKCFSCDNDKDFHTKERITLIDEKETCIGEMIQLIQALFGASKQLKRFATYVNAEEKKLIYALNKFGFEKEGVLGMYSKIGKDKFADVAALAIVLKE